MIYIGNVIVKESTPMSDLGRYKGSIIHYFDDYELQHHNLGILDADKAFFFETIGECVNYLMEGES